MKKEPSTPLADTQPQMVEVKIPENRYSLVHSSLDNKPAVIVVNSGIREFEPKDVFGWTCSLIIDFQDLAQNGMPTREESDIVLDYFEKLDADIRGDEIQPNALFLARITWNGTFEAIWQVNNPKIVHEYLQKNNSQEVMPTRNGLQNRISC